MTVFNRTASDEGLGAVREITKGHSASADETVAVSGVTVGASLFVFVASAPAGSTPTVTGVTDDAGNTYMQAYAIAATSTSAGIALFHTYVKAAPSNVYIDRDYAGNGMAWRIAEVSGFSQRGVDAVSTNKAGTSTAADTNSALPSETNEFVFAAWAVPVAQASTWTPDTDFVLVGTPENNAIEIAVEYRRYLPTGNATSASLTLVTAPTNNWRSMLALFFGFVRGTSIARQIPRTLTDTGLSSFSASLALAHPVSLSDQGVTVTEGVEKDKTYLADTGLFCSDTLRVSSRLLHMSVNGLFVGDIVLKDLAIDFAYQWQRDNSGGGSYSDISGATGPTYALVQADIACYVRCKVTATDAGGSTDAYSAAVGPIAAAVYTSAPSGGIVLGGSVTAVKVYDHQTHTFIATQIAPVFGYYEEVPGPTGGIVLGGSVQVEGAVTEYDRVAADTGLTVTTAISVRCSRSLGDTGLECSDTLARIPLLVRMPTDTGLSVSDLMSKRFGRPIIDVGVVVSDTRSVHARRSMSDSAVTTVMTDAMSVMTHLPVRMARPGSQWIIGRDNYSDLFK